MTAIEWTNETWNPIVGCSVLSPGCTNCYAMRTARRMSVNPATPQYAGTVNMVSRNPVWTGVVHLVEHKLPEAVRWRKPRMIFVNSMGDLFHENVPDGWIDRVFDLMEDVDRHTYQTLTKRGTRMRDYLQRRYPGKPAPAHMWFGVSVEDAARTSRIDDLRAAPAAVRFLSVEPLLGPVGVLDLAGIDWVIVGGESGPGARPMDPQWARSVRDQCVAARVAFFFKQVGARTRRRPDGCSTGGRGTSFRRQGHEDIRGIQQRV